MITIITPFNCISSDCYLFGRAKYFLCKSFVSPEVKRIFVDFASAKNISDELQVLAESRGIKYLRLERFGEPFSAGACRNRGVQDASTEFVTFQDIDLFAPDYVYLELIKRVGNFKFHNDVEVIPCLYLSEDFSGEYVRDGFELGHKSAFYKYLEASSEIKMYAPATSSFLVRRSFFMECGGNRLDFYGHGYEDFDCLNRLAGESNKFVKPRDYYNHNYKYDSPHYCGYRTYFSMFGRELMREKVFFSHLWHPESSAPGYMNRNKINRALFDRFIRVYENGRVKPAPLSGVSLFFKGVTLILAPEGGKSAEAIRQVVPFLGECLYKKDVDFASDQEFEDYIHAYRVERVVFFNSYANDHRLALYGKCKSLNVTAINFDRGGLPDTWFFDADGFNYSSKFYDERFWNFPLEDGEKEEVREYISSILSSNETLEKNGQRVGVYNFKKKHGLSGKKILFVPLQRPNDSVIRHFSGASGGVSEFLTAVVGIARKIKKENWVVVIKKHPLETAFPSDVGDDVVVMVDDENFYDAIAAADAVFLINSGVGLYSLMMNKPTYNIGCSYYAGDGLSVQLHGYDELLGHLKEVKCPNAETVERFIHYLRFKFYSLGRAEYCENVDPVTGSRTSNAIDINFSKVVIYGLSFEKSFVRRVDPYPIYSPFYDYYRGGILLRPVIDSAVGGGGVKNNAILKKNERIDVVFSKAERGSGHKLSRLVRKFAKLKRSPALFFKDAIFNLKRV